MKTGEKMRNILRVVRAFKVPIPKESTENTISITLNQLHVNYAVMMFALLTTTRIVLDFISLLLLLIYQIYYNIPMPADSTQIKLLLLVFIINLLLKSLLIPAYFSTDFHVHQNWLRITSQKPLTAWYFDDISKWTLDYPPFFAYFQCFLSQLAQIFDQNIIKEINTRASTVYFQRYTVIASQAAYLLVLFFIFKKVTFQMLIAYFSLAFILLDNIHFQYNMLMQAIFLLSIHFMVNKQFLLGAFTYSCLLNLKHIYLYSVLAFVACILKEYILGEKSLPSRLNNLVKVGAVTLAPFVCSFAPFLYYGGFQQIKQIIARLFPFQRGLIHQYWAPNFWAVYHFLDKALNFLLARFTGWRIKEDTHQLNSLKYLPEVTPLMTTIIIIALTVPLLVKYIKNYIPFPRLVFLCGLQFFMFGYHTHQKAITPYIGLLLVFTSYSEVETQKNFINSAVFVNILNLVSLLIKPNEKMLRILMVVLWILIWDTKFRIKRSIQFMIIFAGITILFFHELIFPLLKLSSIQFLPLMLNSLFAAAFNLYWIYFLYGKTILDRQNLDSINQRAKTQTHQKGYQEISGEECLT